MLRLLIIIIIVFCCIKLCSAQNERIDTLEIYVEGKVYKVIDSVEGLTLQSEKETEENYTVLDREGKVIKKGKFINTATIDPIIKIGIVTIGNPLEYAIIFNRDD